MPGCARRPIGTRFHSHERSGFTLVEMMIAVAITAIIVAAFAPVMRTALVSSADTRARSALAEEAGFAMERMVRTLRRSPRLILPLGDKSNTMQDESVLDPGVLSLAMSPLLDRDLDGIADADNDGDGLIDEDWPEDMNADGAPGIQGVDDNVDGFPDFSFAGSRDDDETGFFGDEDPENGADDDGDGLVDEDSGSDMNGDGAAGIAGGDDDADGSVDEGSAEDDDEDGVSNEDWIDTITFLQLGSQLVERHPNLQPADGSDWSERVIADGVTRFRVERVPTGNHRSELVDLTLTLGSSPITISLQTRVRVGSDL